MTKVIIYQPSKTAMQSGKAKTGHWLLEYERDTPMTPDALMGWNTMLDTKLELHLEFPTEAEAIAYAEAKGLQHVVKKGKKPRVPPKAYAENFSYNRRNAYDSKVNGDR